MKLMMRKKKSNLQGVLMINSSFYPSHLKNKISRDQFSHPPQSIPSQSKLTKSTSKGNPSHYYLFDSEMSKIAPVISDKFFMNSKFHDLDDQDLPKDTIKKKLP
jgi:hypothetical protein